MPIPPIMLQQIANRSPTRKREARRAFRRLAKTYPSYQSFIHALLWPTPSAKPMLSPDLNAQSLLIFRKRPEMHKPQSKSAATTPQITKHLPIPLFKSNTPSPDTAHPPSLLRTPLRCRIFDSRNSERGKTLLQEQLCSIRESQERYALRFRAWGGQALSTTTQNVRKEVVGILILRHLECKNPLRVLFLALELYDRYLGLSTQEMAFQESFFMACICMLLASKFEDGGQCSILSAHLVHEKILKRLYSLNALISTEKHVLNKLNFYLNASFPLHFLEAHTGLLAHHILVQPEWEYAAPALEKINALAQVVLLCAKENQIEIGEIGAEMLSARAMATAIELILQSQDCPKKLKSVISSVSLKEVLEVPMEPEPLAALFSTLRCGKKWASGLFARVLMDVFTAAAQI